MINMRVPLLLLAAYLSCASAVLEVDDGPDDVVEGWNAWSDCTKPCGNGGITRRDKYCPHMNGGPLWKCGYMSQSCNVKSCQDPFANTEYSECSATCGSGSKEVYTKDAKKWKTIYCATQSCNLSLSLAAVGGKIDVVFMVDSNSYVGGMNWDITKQFVVDVTNALDVSDDTGAVRVGVVNYATFVQNAVELGDYQSKADLQTQILAMPYQAGSSLAYDAIDSMRAMFSARGRDDATRMAVLVTNNGMEKHFDWTAAAAEKARADFINLFVIGTCRDEPRESSGAGISAVPTANAVVTGEVIWYNFIVPLRSPPRFAETISQRVDENKLKTVSSKPLSSYYRLVDNYNDLQTLTDVTAGRIYEQDISPSQAHMEPLNTEGWGDWSTCSATCSHGWQQRKKVCFAGDYYTVCGIRKASCNILPCVDPFRGVEWSPCTTTCGGGVRDRYANDTDGSDGYQQMYCSAQSCNLASSSEATDVVFGLSGSYQCGDLGFESNKQFAMDIVSGCDLTNDRLRFGVMSYGTDTDVAVPCGGYTSKEDLLTSIDEMSFAAGSVNPVGAIGEITNMFAQGGRSDARKIVFIFINGRSGNFPASEATEVMATARKAGLEIYVIAIGNQVDQDMVSAIVSQPASEHVLAVSTYRDLATYTDTTIAQMTGGNIPAEPQDLSNLPYGGWGGWSACTQTCGDGRQTRNKFCDKGTGEFYRCSRQTSSCNSIMCDDLFYGREWSSCSQTCGRGGLRTREAANSVEGFQRIRCGMQSCKKVSVNEETDLIFALGGSRSAGTDGWAISQQLVTDIVNGLELSGGKMKLGLESFSNSYEVAVPLGQYTTKTDFIEDVWDIDYPAGGASVVEAVSGIVDMMKANGRDDARKIAFIIIDGETTHADGLEEVLGEAKDLDIDLFVVGVGERANDSAIIQVAGGESSVLAAENFNLVPQFTDYLVDFATTTGGAHRKGKLFPPSGSEGSIPGSGWHEWHDCNTTCGFTGKQRRYKYCNQSPNTFTKCYTSMASCNTIPYPYHGSKWSECSKECGGGVRSRISSDYETERIKCHNQPCAPYNGNCNVDIIFVLDSSGSIGVYNWFVTKQFVIDVILGMNANMNMTRVGVVVYSTTTCREIELGAYTTDTLEKAVCDQTHCWSVCGRCCCPSCLGRPASGWPQ
ncbi:hypothetical protein NP493_304g03007 [Ridgeia piscesae]|uniref:VWFA domain-containing protein n=1 Tax=Ridgeia piscesae TaxID=27915 RepID=A0AAD9L6C0_RIDPI|nr:hypothetical protein NP493_304g03007 [Ridgeia piscesae]